MMHGRRYASIAILAVAAGCTSPQSELKIRPIAAAHQPVGLEEAQTQLALGNVGTALEGFRTVLRDNPNDVHAAVGVAHSYERMGRFDLARKWYETALAAAPEDAAILTQLAALLDRQGLTADAASVRAEAAAIGAGAPLPVSADTSLALADAAIAPAGPSATITLPPAEPARTAPPAAFASAAPQASVTAAAGPRLERLSFGEVALVTRSEPVWSAEVVKKSERSATVRFVPVRPVARLLNAARQQGLAARTRAQLAGRGWSPIQIGDAPAVREKTLVLYPTTQLPKAKRLAAEFGFTELRRFEGAGIVVLLGRDAARLPILRRT
jgi:tetratricopeptide (TPR) repeat protein